MKYILLYLAICFFLLNSCVNKSQSEIISHIVLLKKPNHDIFGITCDLKVIKNDIFVVNRQSKKILHFINDGKYADLKDSFFYGTIWLRALKEKYGNDTIKLRDAITLYKTIGAQSVIADNNYNYGREFNLNISVLLFEINSSTKRQTFLGKNFYCIHYKSNKYVTENIIIPDSMSKNGNVVNDSGDNFSLCNIVKNDYSTNKLTLTSLKSNKLDYSKSKTIFVPLKFDSIFPPVVLSGYIFSCTYPLYVNILTKKANFFDILPSSIKQIYNTPRSINRQFILACSNIGENVYLLTWEKTKLYVLSINLLTGNTELKKCVDESSIKEIEKSYVYNFDDLGRLVIFNPKSGEFIFINV